MNDERPVWHIGIVFVVGALLFAVLVAVMKLSTNAPAIDADRAALRAKALVEMRAAEAKTINTVGWVDESRGVVRLPIETAMQMVASESPAAARTDLIARAGKAANTAPKVIKKTSAYE